MLSCRHTRDLGNCRKFFYSENLIDQRALLRTNVSVSIRRHSQRFAAQQRAHRAHLRREKLSGNTFVNLLPEFWCLQKQTCFFIFTPKEVHCEVYAPKFTKLYIIKLLSFATKRIFLKNSFQKKIGWFIPMWHLKNFFLKCISESFCKLNTNYFLSFTN